MKRAQKSDTKAFEKFTAWLEKALTLRISLDELTIAEKIYKFRKEDPHFISESFATIAGYASNSAIVHYHPNEKSNKICQGEIPILLLDSGGQYDFGGTTDITRVFALGEVPERVKDIYTDLLRGHLALASAFFPKGTNGSQLDLLARYYLWKRGFDYGHGTGHGVGHFSSVHEGPQGLTQKNQTPLEAGMIVSIEPGYYEEGAFGLRIENLYLVVESNNNFLTFEPLTQVPLDKSLIKFERLSEEERKLFPKFFPPS
jgi:Xaa-Pro aminopeptidase